MHSGQSGQNELQFLQPPQNFDQGRENGNFYEEHFICNSFLVIYDHVDCCSFRWQCSGPPKGAGLEVEKLLLYCSLLFLGMKVQHETVVHSHIANTITFRKTGNLFQTKNKDKFSTGNVTNKMHYHWWAPKSCFSRHHG